MTKTASAAAIGNFLFIRSKTFQKLTMYAFEACDTNGEGRIARSELYAGILLVHVKLAKFCGPAACYPPSQRVVDQLFDAADDDKSGYIDKEEFQQIAVICCAQIASRIVVYLFALIVAVPYLAKILVLCMVKCDDWIGYESTRFKDSVLNGLRLHQSILDWIEKVMTWHRIAEKIVGMLIIMYLVPACFDYIDKYSKDTAERTIMSKTKSIRDINRSRRQSIMKSAITKTSALAAAANTNTATTASTTENNNKNEKENTSSTTSSPSRIHIFGFLRGKKKEE